MLIFIFEQIYFTFALSLHLGKYSYRFSLIVFSFEFIEQPKVTRI